MAKISELPAIDPTGDETVVVLRDGETKRAGLGALVGAAMEPSREVIDAAVARAEKAVRSVTTDGEGDGIAFGIANEDTQVYVPLVDDAGRLVAIDPIDGGISPALSATPAPSIDDEAYAAAIINPDTGEIAPFMDASGRLVSPSQPGGMPKRTLNVDDLPPLTRYTAPRFNSAALVIPIAWSTAATPIAVVHLMLGQSNSIGENDASPGNAAGRGPDALVATAARYPANALMLAGGVRRNSAFGIARSTTLVPLVEQTQVSMMETGASGFAAHFIRDVFAATGVYPTVVSLAPSLGGIPYVSVKRGSPEVYDDILNAIEDAAAALRAAGFTRIHTVVDYVGHESDGGVDLLGGDQRMTRRRIVRQYQQLERDLSEDIAARTGERHPVFFINQVFNGASADGFDQPHIFGAADLDGVGNWRCAGPMYPLGTWGGIHLSCRGQNRRGQQVARAAVAELCGAGWRPTAVTDHWWVSDTRFVLQVDCMGIALATDAGAAAPYGLAFRDGSGAPPAISAVTLSGRTIVVDLVSAPTGRRPQVAYAGGGGGQIHDNTAHTNIYDGGTAANWLLAFVRDLRR